MPNWPMANTLRFRVAKDLSYRPMKSKRPPCSLPDNFNASNPMILISRTFEIVTPESAEFGESDDAGFICQSEPVTFRELVSLMREHPVPSSSPCAGSRWDWLSSYPEENYRDCSNRTESLHFDKSNPPSRDKYWRKAMRAAGIRVRH